MPPEVLSVLGASIADRWMNCTPSVQLTAGVKDETTRGYSNTHYVF